MSNGWNDQFRNRAEILRDKRWLKAITGVKTWQLLLILVGFVMLAAIFLRLNNLGMYDRRVTLVKADETGDIAQIQTAAKDLQNYVAHHMNTMTGRIPLQALYNQAAQAAMDAAKPPEVDSGVYQRATDECRPQLQNYGYKAWANCISERVGVTDFNAETETAPDPDAYYVEYASARWSLDLAGISVLICFLLIMVIVLRLISALFLRILLRIRYRISG